jgi:hypothetical protein
VIDPAIETHYGTGYERSRLFPGGQPSLEYVRSMELLERLLPAPRPGSWMWAGARDLCRAAGPARVTGAPGRSGAAARGPGPPGGRRRPGRPVHRRAGRRARARRAWCVLGRGAAVRAAVSPDRGGQRRQALAQARRVLVPGGRLLAMAVSRFA